MKASGAEAQGQAINIACMNVKFSPNLGDGLLSECLEAALVSCGAAAGTGSIDLAGRQGYGQGMAGRGAIMGGLDALPDGLRHWAVRPPLALQSRRKWAPHYEAGLAGAQAVAIGGGNLLSDHDLNFPTKIALALRCAGARRLPVAFYGCGMADHWSREGDRRLRRALSEGVVAVMLRDGASKARWDARFAEAARCEATVVRDPGLLAHEVYGPAPRSDREGPVIGIGIMSHVAIRYHSAAQIESGALSRWYVDLARDLIGRGASVVAFTNGAPEDEAAAALIAPELEQLGVRRVTPTRPRELSDIVGGCDAIAAYRMHAVIAAYAHQVPALAFTWDDKLDAFLESVDCPHWLADPATLSATDAAQRLLDAAQEGIDTAAHARVMHEARAGVAGLYAALTAARSSALA